MILRKEIKKRPKPLKKAGIFIIIVPVEAHEWFHTLPRPE